MNPLQCGYLAVTRLASQRRRLSSRKRHFWLCALWALWLVTASLTTAQSQPLPTFDFTKAAEAALWAPTHDIGSLSCTSTGLVVQITGRDPYTTGPARDYPVGTPLWLRLKLFSEEGGSGQVFYYDATPVESKSARFYVAPGKWQEVTVPIPPLGAGWKLRLDPPGGSGTCVLGQLRFEERVLYSAPAWPAPTMPRIARNARRLRSGELELTHNRDALGAFQLSFNGKVIATGNPQAVIGYDAGKQVRWIPFGNSPGNKVSSRRLRNGFSVRSVVDDADGARWRIEQEFTSNAPNAIKVVIRVSADQDRQLVYLPAFTLLAGVGGFGTNKSQGLLAGLEYLENEPSSSTLDVRGDAASRLVPDRKKITLPLMAVAAGGCCLGLTWDPQPGLAPVFDSPDRQFNSGGHLLGLLAPGSDGNNRDEGKLLPYFPWLLRARQPLVVRAILIAEAGQTVIPAVQEYLALKGLPAMPAAALGASAYYRRTAQSWLDSSIITNDLVRHAVWPGFGPQPAADAAVWMKWVGQLVNDPDLTARLSDRSAAVLGRVSSPSAWNSASVGHVRYPVAALVFGSVLENVDQAKAHAQGLLKRFQPDGSVPYVAPAGKTDLGSTHNSREANGLASAVVWSLLDEASFSCDEGLVKSALTQLRALDKFRDTVPRGAQTWEVPLHTPDILASAHLVRAYLRGYQLTGEANMLEQAKYWAWTGVPFVYLTPPVPAEVGLYATIPVFGATEWVGSWFGRPVQWCGLVYAEALHQLAEYDPAGPWRHLANGIAASGTQQIWPPTDAARQGLLPDFYLLQEQVSDGPAINPGTLQSQAMQYYTGLRPYSFRAVRRHGLFVHAAGSIGDLRESSTGVSFTVTPWASTPTFLLVGGLKDAPGVKIDGASTPLATPHQFDASRGLLVLQVQRKSSVNLEFGTSNR